MNLYEAIFTRKSVRHYKMEPIEKKVMDNMMKYANTLDMLAEHHKVQFQIVENLKVKPALNGNFTVKAPYYLVLTSLQNEDYLINAGYLMEQVALYLTTKGIGSCFLGAYRTNLDLEEGYVAAAVLAFGKTESNIYRDAKKFKRLQLNELCTYKANVGENVKVMLQAARLAPSAMNNQPWRFVVYENRIHIFCKKDLTFMKQYKSLHYIDIGITLANLILAAEELWLNVEMMKSENIAEKSFKKNEYMLTVKIAS